MRKKTLRAASLALAAAMLCGCQSNPEKQAVVSKNDGAFDAAILETAPADGIAGSKTQQLRCQDSFSSTDGSCRFNLNIDQEISMDSLSVVEVEPYYFTEEDVQRIADILLPGAQFYERQAEYVEKKFSKSQLQEKIARASQYANEESLKKFYGSMYSDEMFLSMDEEGTDLTPVDRFKEEVNHYMELLETASDEDPRTPCEWTWKLETNYREGPEEASRRSGIGEKHQIQANASANGVEYWLWADKLDGPDSKISRMGITTWGSLSPWYIDQFIYRYQLMEDKEPTQEQVAAAEEKARDILLQIGIGNWEVGAGSVRKDVYGEDCPCIWIEAGPVLRGTPSLWRLQNISAGSSEFGLNYDSTKAYFIFNADGILEEFKLWAPIREKTVVNEAPAILSADEMLTRAKDSLTLTDIENYVHPAFIEGFVGMYEKTPKFTVDITEAAFGLVRVNVKDAPGSYYYVPGLVLSGSKSLCDPDTGEALMRSGEEPSWLGRKEIAPLIGINAIDGSIIPVS